jgi:hypothetical protein
MASRTLRSRTTDLDEDRTQLSESAVCEQPEQLEFPSTEFTEIGLERERPETFSENEEQTQVSTDRLGEKNVTETSSNSTVTANVQLQEILANILSTLQANKMEMMACVKEGNEKLKRELKEEVRRENAKLIERLERENFKLSQNLDEKLQKETNELTKVIQDVKEGSEGEFVGIKRNMHTLFKELNDRHDYLASEKRKEDVWLNDSMDDFVDEIMEAELIQETGLVEYVESEMTHERVVSKVLTFCESNIDDFASELTVVENIKPLRIEGGGDNKPITASFLITFAPAR